MFLSKIADALVERLAPRARAGACCEERGQCESYPCDEIGPGYQKLCCKACNCGDICTACYLG